jgi:DNA polymerase-4
VPTSNRLYSATSRQIIAILRDYTPLVEVFSIDEAFLDLSGSLRLFGPAEQIARQIKDRIRDELGLNCSIGIAPNKLLAKLASDLQKPDGLVVVRPDQVARLLETMPVGELCGIGRATARQLSLLGITTCGQLGRFPVEVLKKRFGVVGIRLQQMGQGRDASAVVPEEEAAEVQSVGHSMTFSHDLSDDHEIRAKLLQLAELVGRRARRYGVSGGTVTLTVRYADFSTFSRQERQSDALALSDDIYRASLRILDDLQLEQPVRLLGIALSTLQRTNDQLPLFPEQQRRLRATAAMDAVNNRYGDFTVMQASLLDQREKGSHVISPAWKPEGIRHVTVT